MVIAPSSVSAARRRPRAYPVIIARLSSLGTHRSARRADCWRLSTEGTSPDVRREFPLSCCELTSSYGSDGLPQSDDVPLAVERDWSLGRRGEIVDSRAGWGRIAEPQFERPP